MLNAVEISRDCRETVKEHTLYIFKAGSVFINTAMEGLATRRALHRLYLLRCLAFRISPCLCARRLWLHPQSWLRLWGLAFRLALCLCLEVPWYPLRVVSQWLHKLRGKLHGAELNWFQWQTTGKRDGGVPSTWCLLCKSTHYYQTWCSLQIAKQVCGKAPSYLKARWVPTKFQNSSDFIERKGVTRG